MWSAKRVITAAVLMLLMTASAGAHTQLHSPSATPSVARTMPEVETAILQALAAANLTDRLKWVAADTNGHLTIAWLVLTYPADLVDPVSILQARAWDLVRTTFAAVPSLDEIDLTGLPRGSDPFGTNRHWVTFSAAASRTEFLGAERTPDTAQPFSHFPRVWFHPALVQPGRHLGADRSSAGPTRPPVPDGSMRFSGDQVAQAEELRHHLVGLAYGTIIDGKLYHGNPSQRAVALTFDDGPFPIYTSLLLDTLDRLNLKATFFLVGEQVQQYPYFAQAIAHAGHEVANHSFHHPNLARLPEQAVEDELRGAQEAITTVTGETPRFFRPPGGDYNDTVLRVARSLGLVTVFWTDNPADYASTGPRALEAKALANITNGGILLFHQGVGDTIRILPQTAEALRQRGMTLTTVSGLLAPVRTTKRRVK